MWFRLKEKVKTAGSGHSIVYWFRVFLVILLFLILLVGALFERQMKQALIRQKITDLNTMLEIYVGELDASFDSLQNYLYASLLDSAAITRIETGGTPTEISFARMEVSNALADISSWDERVESLIFYSPESPDHVLMENGLTQSFSSREYMQQVLTETIDSGIEDGTIGRQGYLMVAAENDNYILRFYKIRNSYVGMGISAESILEALNENMNDYESVLFIADDEGHVLDSTGSVPENVDISRHGTVVDTEEGSALQINVMTSGGDFYVGRMMPTSDIFSQIDQVRIMLVIMLVVVLAVVECFIFLICHFINRPVERLMAGMKRTGEGQWDQELAVTGCVREFRMLMRTFNEMIGEIKTLKIKNYETQLQSQKVYLQYLQLQINPHFYLNALNIVYSLAEIGDFKTIQKMILALVKYLRYHFQDVNTLVTVSQELDHVRSYIEIQQIRFSDAIEYEEMPDEDVEMALLPPFIIQSFVENSVKYALKNHQKGRLFITAWKEEAADGDYLMLEIRDNGDGYSEEVLTAINTGQVLTDDKGGKIGIRNVMERLSIIYGEKAKVQLSNDGGAVTHVRIPLILREM